MMVHLRIISILTGIINSFAYDNLSGDKSATQKSTWACNGCPDGSYNAEMAVDNNLKTCTRNVNPSGIEWWMVDLQETQSIYAVKFAFREHEEIDQEQRQQRRLSGYFIYVSNSPEIKSGEVCFKHNGTYLPSLKAEHICPSFGRYVQFVNNDYIELCDFIVLGCHRGHYGVDCNTQCPIHCKNDQCFVTNGTCLACANGWTGVNCNQACSAGTYGPDCSLSCSGHCRNNSTCNPTDGICSDGCTEGWMNKLCNQSCSAGTFGPNCKNNCSGNCLYDTVCNRTTGTCDKGCKPGYQGERCNEVCSSGYFGKDCLMKCSPFCKENLCESINGHCKKGCISGYQDPACNKTCNRGMYGHNCSLSCGKCVSQSCNHITGSCYRCEPGWSGPKCSLACSAGKYGPNCINSCSQNCINKTTCNHVTGICENGCANGYKGTRCQLICSNGYFGANCSNVCSENCSDICHHIDGMCNCKAGMMDSPECIQVSALTTARKCDDHCFYAIGISILVILNILTCALWIRERRRQVKVKRQSFSHYITTEAEMKEKTYESHEYQEVNSVSRDFSYQNLTFDT